MKQLEYLVVVWQTTCIAYGRIVRPGKEPLIVGVAHKRTQCVSNTGLVVV